MNVDQKRSESQAWYARGGDYLNLSLFDDALTCFQRAVELDAGFSEAWFIIGQILVRKRDFDGAGENFDISQLCDERDAQPGKDNWA